MEAEDRTGGIATDGDRSETLIRGLGERLGDLIGADMAAFGIEEDVDAYVYHIGDCTEKSVGRLERFVRSLLSFGRYAMAEDVDIALPAVIFRVDAPGGDVSLNTQAATLVERLTDFGFRTIASVDRCALSGGYWIASMCSEIVVGKYARIGSVGVLSIVGNEVEGARSNGTPIHIFAFPPDKGYPYNLASAPAAYLAKMQESVEAFYAEFLGAVLARRSSVRSDVSFVDASEVTGVEAVARGWADRVGLFDDVVANFDPDAVVVVGDDDDVQLDTESGESARGNSSLRRRAAQEARRRTLRI